MLSKAKNRAQSIACLSNLKQLELCLHLYVMDNNDYFVPNNSIALAGSDAILDQGLSWLPDTDADTEYDLSNIISGLLFAYNTSLPIYHCPSDQSLLTPINGQPTTLRWRSYNLSQSINGYPQGQYGYNIPGSSLPSWSKYTEVRQPIPSGLFVFIDENADTIEDAEFGSPPVGSSYQQNV